MIVEAASVLLWYAVWLLLSWPLNAKSLALGLPVALFVHFATRDLFIRSGRIFTKPERYLWFIGYVAVFLWECVKANLDVAYRVIHPDLPIRPGTIRVKTSLRSDAGLTFLANSITLTPGTTSVDIDREAGVLYVHCLSVSPEYDRATMKLKVVDRFESILRRIFE